MKALMIFFILCSPIFAQDKSEKPEAPRKGKITGRVLGDDGTPLEGANVSVGSMSNKDNKGWQPILTDEEGNFVATGLKAGSYSVSANSPGLVTPEISDDVKYYHPGETVTLSLVKGGVITGRVTDSRGEPVIAAPIQAIRIRDSAGRKVKEVAWYARNRKTDDQGNYRLYGLPSGKYLIAVGGKNQYSWGLPNGYENSTLTYYPSASREAATEVNVNTGEEVSGINIRFHNEKGHIISGKITGGTTEISTSAISVEVRTLPSLSLISFATLLPGIRDFSVFGIADGEYQIQANHNDGWGPAQKDSYRSTTRKVIVKGNNISGLTLHLLPLSSVEGKVEIAVTPEKNRSQECKSSRTSIAEEVVVTLRRETIGKEKEADSNADELLSNDLPNERGEIKFSNLESARYRVTAKLPDETWYIKSISLKSAAPKTPVTKNAALSSIIDVGRQGLSLSPGEKLKDLLISIADGAAGVKGRIITDPNKILPTRMRAFLVPAEKESAEDVLRYYEVKTRDGNFILENLAPGKYLMLARPIPESEADEMPATPTAWEAAARLSLRREAEAAGNLLELNSCQRVNDYSLKFTQTKK